MKKLIIMLTLAAIAATGWAVTISAYSTQQTLINSGDTVAMSDAGKVQAKYFTWTTTAISNSTVALVRVPANSRIIGGQIAMGAGSVGGQVVSLGLIAVDGGGYINKPTTTADNTTLFLSSINASNAVLDTFGYLVNPGEASDTNPNYAGFDTDVYLSLTSPSGAGVPPLTAGKALTGYILYIKD